PLDRESAAAARPALARCRSRGPHFRRGVAPSGRGSSAGNFGQGAHDMPCTAVASADMLPAPPRTRARPSPWCSPGDFPLRGFVMVALIDLWLPILLSAVFVFLVSS